MIIEDLLRGGAIVGAGVAAGSALLVADLVAPRIAALPSELGYRMHDAFLHHDDHTATAVVPSVFAAVCGLLVIILDGPGEPAGILTGIAIAVSASVGIVTARISGPANDEIRRLNAETDRPEYSDVRRRWWRWHVVRAVCALVAFLGYTVAALAA
jgi:hypothetical protein